MTFPVYFELGPWRLHPHLVMEAIAYSVGLYISLFRKRLWQRSRAGQAGEVVSDLSTAEPTVEPITAEQRASIAVGALAGALVGARLLVLFQHLDLLAAGWKQYALLAMQGKTIVGALLGGLVGVEMTKKRLGISRSTGDGFVFSVMVGMAIGRVGCFLTGLSDRTYGVATALPWGVDFGDGIARHPTQLYEVAFLLLLIVLLGKGRQHICREGDLFKIFMIAYLSFRFSVDFIKPAFRPLLGVSAIQIACVAGLIYYRRDIARLLKTALTMKA
ncbi:MAG: prolipoprotein diacylglyceryl transferase family protein [Cyanobacteria bacterium J06623_5]